MRIRIHIIFINFHLLSACQSSISFFKAQFFCQITLLCPIQSHKGIFILNPDLCIFCIYALHIRLLPDGSSVFSAARICSWYSTVKNTAASILRFISFPLKAPELFSRYLYFNSIAVKNTYVFSVPGILVFRTDRLFPGHGDKSFLSR